MSATIEQEKVEKKPASAPQENAVVTPVAAPEQVPKKEIAPALKPEMSKGEKWFNWTVYSGLNYWVNLISSIAIADYFIHKGGRQKLDWVIGKGAKTLEATGLMKIKPAYKNSKTAFETLSVLGGGWLLLVPMKILEDHKRGWVHWLNDKLGVDQTAPDGHKETPDEIYIEQEQPKQTWFNVFKRRIYASLAVIGTGQIMEYALADKKIKKPDRTYRLNPYDKTSETVTFEGGHMGGKEWVESNIVGGVNWAAKQLPGSENFTKPGSWMQRWLGLAALDTFFTKVSAVVMHMTNGAKKAKAPHEINDEIDPPATFEIGDELKPHEHRETVIVPDKVSSKAAQVRRTENFTDKLLASQETPSNMQMAL